MPQRITLTAVLAVLGLSLTLVPPAWAKKAEGCAPDAVQVDPACIDTYEAGVWEIAPANTGARA